jgi:hypothetical protein
MLQGVSDCRFSQLNNTRHMPFSDQPQTWMEVAWPLERRTNSPRSSSPRCSSKPSLRASSLRKPMRSKSFAASSLRSRSPPTLRLTAQARAKARQAAADKVAGDCQHGDIEPSSASPVRILSSTLDQGRQPFRPQHTSPSLSCFRPVIVGTEWYKSPVASKLAAFTELARAAETPVLAQCVKTKWKPTPNSAPDGSYARRRTFDRNAAGLPPARSITDLP